MNFSPSIVTGFSVLTGIGEPNKRAENSRPPADGLPDGKIIGGSTTMNRESAYDLDKKYLTQQEVADLFRVKTRHRQELEGGGVPGLLSSPRLITGSIPRRDHQSV
jgi:hypothetical protein